jgi:hypothetical protein
MATDLGRLGQLPSGSRIVVLLSLIPNVSTTDRGSGGKWCLEEEEDWRRRQREETCLLFQRFPS